MHPFRKRSSRPGASPGTLQAPADKRVEKVVLEVFEYGPDHVEEKRVESFDDLLHYRDSAGISWLNIVGVHDVELLQQLGERYGLHPLALEDVVNVGQRPKHEEYGDHQFVVMKLIHPHEKLEVEQISLFLGERFVITFQEIPGDVFEPVRERIRHGRGRIRKAGADYLAYALIDALVDQFFPLLERYGERIQELEDEVMEDPTEQTLNRIHSVKRELLALRRVAWPQREVLSSLERLDPPAVREETRVFLRDCYDHTIQIMDMLETYRDLAASLLDVYLSSVSNRMNEVMKVLTVMASIFIPLTFLAGIYGMNFDPQASPWNMPELGWRWGYPAFWVVMLLVGGALVWYFRRKGWL